MQPLRCYRGGDLGYPVIAQSQLQEHQRRTGREAAVGPWVLLDSLLAQMPALRPLPLLLLLHLLLEKGVELLLLLLQQRRRLKLLPILLLLANELRRRMWSCCRYFETLG